MNYQSLLITGATQDKRFNKALSFSPIKPPHPDLIIYEFTSSIGIDEVRQLINQLCLKPFEADIKVAIINQAEKLTIEAQNCLLKTLEEPPANTRIILITENPGLLLPTIVSRCQILNLKLKEFSLLDENIFNQNVNFLKMIFNSRGGERLKLVVNLPQEKEALSSSLNLLIKTCQALILANYGIKKSLIKAKNFNQMNYHGQSPWYPQATPSASSFPCASSTSKPRGGLRASKIKKTSASVKSLYQIIRASLETQSLVEQNVNLKLALDCFLLNLPSCQELSTSEVG